MKASLTRLVAIIPRSRLAEGEKLQIAYFKSRQQDDKSLLEHLEASGLPHNVRTEPRVPNQEWTGVSRDVKRELLKIKAIL